MSVNGMKLTHHVLKQQLARQSKTKADPADGALTTKLELFVDLAAGL